VAGRRQLLQKALREKALWRLERARLPMAEKVRALIRMQTMANEIRLAAGRPLRTVWSE